MRASAISSPATTPTVTPAASSRCWQSSPRTRPWNSSPRTAPSAATTASIRSPPSSPRPRPIGTPGPRRAPAAGSGAAPPPRHHIRHFTGTHQIDLVDETHAVGRCYFSVIMPHGLDHWGRYIDEYGVRDGRWVITLRRALSDGRVDRESRHLTPASPAVRSGREAAVHGDHAAHHEPSLRPRRCTPRVRRSRRGARAGRAEPRGIRV